MDIVYNKGRSGRTNVGVVKGGRLVVYGFWKKEKNSLYFLLLMIEIKSSGN